MRFELELPAPSPRPPTVRIPFDSARVQSPALPLAQFKRILVVKLDHVGDWVLCTPFFENLARSAPRADIDVLVLEPVLELASASPHLTRVAAIADKHDRRITLRAIRRSDGAGLRRNYVGRRYDLAIVPRWDADFDGAAAIACGSGAPVIFGFSENCTRRKRVLNRGSDRLFTHVVEQRRSAHEVVHNLALLEAMGGSIRTRTLSPATTPADREAASAFLAGAFRGQRKPLLAVAPFASEPKRTVPVTRMAELIRPIVARAGCDVVVLGSAQDRLAGERLARLISVRAHSAAGRLTICEAVEVIRRCDAMIAVDSAPAHIAAAVETPVAVLSCHPLGGSPDHANSPKRFGPWGDSARVTVLQPQHARRPCQMCCVAGEPHCILSIDTQALQGMQRFVAQALAGRDSGLPAARLPDLPRGRTSAETATPAATCPTSVSDPI
jgi:heptosyltransferase-2